MIAVADGVGSYDGAQNASQSAIRELPELVRKGNLQNMTSLFFSLKEGVSSLSEMNIKFSHAATTLTFCFVDDEGLHIGHVGDCRLYVKTDSKLKQITKDHTQHQKLLDDKIYSKSELKQLPGKNTHYGNRECDPASISSKPLSLMMSCLMTVTKHSYI